ncbi:cuticle protein 19.8-like [Bombyx mandarina]|uniref:Cuticle protein 19.8-like n=1 Tax=Bombyx mandarina TaxID=7092 RepID=A0A6J2JAF0_BOMMA|nr:cuticle protein 19.8-like [Bombyx mandarina]
MFQVSCLLAVTALAKADDSWGGLVYAPRHASVDYYAYPRYAFEYSVNDPHTGDKKAQWENRDGDVVKGAYSLVEPDGSIRIVEYYADAKSGFNAVVKRIGPNLHPPTVHAAPISPIVGPVAKLGGLAAAPLISGPLYGGAVSTASLYKDHAPAVIPAPILPVSYKAPLPYAPAPIWPSAAYPTPIIKSGPILSAPIYPAALPGLKTPLNLGDYGSLGLWNDGLFKAPLGPNNYLDHLGHGLLTKGAYPSLGPNYSLLGLKH